MTDDVEQLRFDHERSVAHADRLVLENDRYRAALEQIRDQDRVENVLDPQWSARIAELALNPEAEEATT